MLGLVLGIIAVVVIMGFCFRDIRRIIRSHPIIDTIDYIAMGCMVIASAVLSALAFILVQANPMAAVFVFLLLVFIMA